MTNNTVIYIYIPKKEKSIGCYIGQAKNEKQRAKQHYRAAFTNTPDGMKETINKNGMMSYSYYSLQSNFGIKNILDEIKKDGQDFNKPNSLSKIDDLDIAEILYICKAMYKGIFLLNTQLGSQKPYLVNGKEYSKFTNKSAYNQIIYKQLSPEKLNTIILNLDLNNLKLENFEKTLKYQLQKQGFNSNIKGNFSQTLQDLINGKTNNNSLDVNIELPTWIKKFNEWLPEKINNNMKIEKNNIFFKEDFCKIFDRNILSFLQLYDTNNNENNKVTNFIISKFLKNNYKSEISMPKIRLSKNYMEAGYEIFSQDYNSITYDNMGKKLCAAKFGKNSFVYKNYNKIIKEQKQIKKDKKYGSIKYY